MIGLMATPLLLGENAGENPYLTGCIGLWNLGGTLASSADLSGNGRTANIADNGASNIALTTLDGRQAVSADGGATAARYTLGSITSADPLSLVGATVATVVFRGSGTGTTWLTTAARLIDKSDGGNAQNGWAVWVGGVGGSEETSHRFGFQFGGGALVACAAEGRFINSTVARTYGIEMRPTGSSASHLVYRDGSLVETVSGTLATAPTATANAALLNWNHSTSRMFQGNMDFLGVWNRALSAAEHAAIHADPGVLGI